MRRDKVQNEAAGVVTGEVEIRKNSQISLRGNDNLEKRKEKKKGGKKKLKLPS